MAIKIETAVWEQLPGKGEVKLYTLSNDSGMKVTVSSLGAVIVKLIVPDQDGKEADVVLGFDRGGLSEKSQLFRRGDRAQRKPDRQSGVYH